MIRGSNPCQGPVRTALGPDLRMHLPSKTAHLPVGARGRMPSAPSTTIELIAHSRPRLCSGVISEALPGGGLILRGAPLPRGPVRRALARVFRLPERLAVELDAMGAFVVERLDGRSVAELAQDVARHLRLTRREAEGAVGMFLRLLLRRKLIEIDGSAQHATASDGRPVARAVNTAGAAT